MFELSQKAKYALIFLNFLSNQDNKIYSSVKIISNQTGLPYRFLSQIAVDLKRAGIVDAKEGKGGGYYLKKLLDKVSLKTMVEAVDGKVGFVECQIGEFCGNQDYCHSRGKWDEIRNEVAKVLEKFKVSEIV